MALDASILRAMQAAGASIDIIIAAVEADAAIERAKADERRAKDADRQRRHRLSRDVTVTNGDGVTLVSPQSPPLKVSPDPLQITPPLTPHPPENKRGRSLRLPEDWQPSPLSGKAAEMVRRWQPGELERELAKFRNYWLAKGANATSTNWQRNWVNWLIKADETKANRNERSNNPTADAVTRILGNC